MKTLIATLLSLVFLGCADERVDSFEKYSKNQQHLINLSDDYKKFYHRAINDDAKEKVQDLYLQKLHMFLVDTLERYIDSMAVTVDSVKQEGWKVTTQFHTHDIEFKYSMTFMDSMPPKVDSFYNFMRNLKPGADVVVNFVHLGGAEVIRPTNSKTSVFRIFAYPEPL
jgi:hypothetical protein